MAQLAKRPYLDDDEKRELQLSELMLCASTTMNELKSLEMELPLAKMRAENVVPETVPKNMIPELNAGGDKRGDRLDGQSSLALRPNSAQARAQVFRPGFNLPTMSIEEAGEIEMRLAQERAARNAPPAISPHDMDDTKNPEEKDVDSAQAIAEARYWDEFKDENPTGSGNRYNMG